MNLKEHSLEKQAFEKKVFIRISHKFMSLSQFPKLQQNWTKIPLLGTTILNGDAQWKLTKN